MILAKVIGTVTSTQKNKVLEGKKILMVRPVTPEGKPAGKIFCAVDCIQAGAGDRVLVLDEGNSARSILGDSRAPVRTVIVGIVDSVDI